MRTLDIHEDEQPEAQFTDWGDAGERVVWGANVRGSSGVPRDWELVQDCACPLIHRLYAKGPESRCLGLMIDLSDAPASTLLELHVDVLAELRRREVVRSANNPTGDYGEVQRALEERRELHANHFVNSGQMGGRGADTVNQKTDVFAGLVPAKNNPQRLCSSRVVRGYGCPDKPGQDSECCARRCAISGFQVSADRSLQS